MNLTKIVKIESQEDYESTVPSTVRLANEEKARSCLKITPTMSLTQFRSLTEENARGGHPAPGAFYRDVHADEVNTWGRDRGVQCIGYIYRMLWAMGRLRGVRRTQGCSL